MGHIEEVLNKTRKSQFFKNATELLLAGLVVVITACKSKSINNCKYVNLLLVRAHIFENRMWCNMAETIMASIRQRCCIVYILPEIINLHNHIWWQELQVSAYYRWIDIWGNKTLKRCSWSWCSLRYSSSMYVYPEIASSSATSISDSFIFLMKTAL